MGNINIFEISIFSQFRPRCEIVRIELYGRMNDLNFFYRNVFNV